MIAFLGCVIISVVISWIIACTWGKSGKVDTIIAGAAIGIILGVGASFWGGSFVKQEIVVEKYFISPMFFDGNGNPIVALMEEKDFSLVESYDYIFQIKEGEKLKLIKHSLYEKDIFFFLNEGEERRLEIKSSKTCRKNMWIWFFYITGFIESKVMLKNGDNFLTLPRYYSL